MEAAAAKIAEQEEVEEDSDGNDNEKSPFDWDAMSAADDEENDDASFDMPPRLVTFVYLQDCLTAAHGPTAFLPGSLCVKHRQGALATTPSRGPTGARRIPGPPQASAS